MPVPREEGGRRCLMKAAATLPGDLQVSLPPRRPRRPSLVLYVLTVDVIVTPAAPHQSRDRAQAAVQAAAVGSEPV